MSHTFTKLTVHSVFGTKDRRELITPPLQARLYPYMMEVLNDGFGLAREIGGAADHTHMLFDLNRDRSVAECMRQVKSVSSGWVRATFPDLRHFGWQEGYGAFSVSSPRMEMVADYIRTQEEHHKKRSFEQEFRALLDKYGVQYDPQFLWK